MNKTKRMFLIKFAYFLGIGADALWAVGLLSPKIFSILTGQPAFNPDLQVRLIMGIGGTLMTGWTFLLLWAVKLPVERRVVILLTAFPVVLGLTVVAVVGFLGGNTSNLWIIIKNSILFLSMITSYVLACKAAKEKHG